MADNEVSFRQRAVTEFIVNPLTPELNPSAQRYLTRFFHC
jgi:hypothetical protein